jgi:urease accessory protein
MRWHLLQLVDSAFPTGGFAHSCGLEAAAHLGVVDSAESLDAYVRAHLWNVGQAALPFVAAAYDDPGQWAALDLRLDAQLTSHVANRASRTQGRAFLSTCERVFDEPHILALAADARARGAPSHVAPAFGATVRALGAARRETLGLYLYVSLRAVVSAAVRLGVVGPHEAQRLQLGRSGELDDVLAHSEALAPAQAATVAPVSDILGAAHDTLYSRLFLS